MLWNVIANLAQNVELGPCWVVFLFFIPALWQGKDSSQHFFPILWDDCELK